MKSAKRILRLCIAAMLMVVCTTSTFTYAETDNSVHLSDVYWGYPSYLTNVDPTIDNGYNQAFDLLDGIDSGDEFWVRFRSILKDSPNIVLGEALSAAGYSDITLLNKTQMKAAKLLMKEVATDDALYKEWADQIKEENDLMDYLSDWEDYVEALNDLTEISLGHKEIIDEVVASEEVKVLEMVEDVKQDDYWGSISDTTDLMLAVTEVSSNIYLMAAINEELLQYLIDNCGSSDLKEALQTYQNYINSNYAEYIRDYFINEQVIDKILKIKNVFKIAASEGSGASLYVIVRLACKALSSVIGQATKLGDTEDYIVATMMQRYANEYQFALNDLCTYMINNPVTYDTVTAYRRAYVVYVASVKAYIKSVESVFTDDATVYSLEYAIKAINEKASIEQHEADAIEAIQSTPVSERKIKKDDTFAYYEFNGLVSITGPTDMIERNTIYTVQGRIFHGIKIDGTSNSFGQLLVKTDTDCPGDILLYARAYNSYGTMTLENCNATVKGDVLCSELTVNEDSKLVIEGDLKGYGTYTVKGALTANKIYAQKIGDYYRDIIVSVEGDKAHLIVNEQMSVSNYMQAGGTADFYGTATEYGDNASFNKDLKGTVHYHTPYDQTVNLQYFGLDPVPEGEDLGPAELTVEYGDEAVVITGTAPSHIMKTMTYGSWIWNSTGSEVAGLKVSGGLTLTGTGSVNITGDVKKYLSDACSLTFTNQNVNVSGDVLIDSITVHDGGNITVGGKIKGDNLKVMDDSRIAVGGNLECATDCTAGEIILDGNAQQIVYPGTFDKLILENGSADGVIFYNKITVSTLFDHNRNVFSFDLPQYEKSSTFVDYDGDGISDNLDPYPRDPDISSLSFTIDPIEDQTYTGSEIILNVAVKDEKGNSLTEGTDYTAVFSNNTEVGTATISITGIGHYKTYEPLTTEFKIVGDDPCAAGHELIKTEAVDAACTVDGNIAYWTCSICDKVFSDEAGTNEINKEDMAIPAKGHDCGGLMREVSPTCTTTGLAPHYQCTVCGQFFDRNKQECTLEELTIPLLDHEWETEMRVDKAPTCTEDGSQSFHCTRCDATTGAETIPSLGHAWDEPVYTWSDDFSTVTATMACRNDAEHKHTVSEKAGTAAEVTKPATFTAAGETTYTVVFTNKSFYTQTKVVANIPKLAKKANPITVKAKTVTVKYSKLKKKTQTIAATKAFAVSKAQGKITYKVAAYDKKAKKKITVNSAGKVTVKKGLKKGKYKVKVTITAAGNTAYKAGSKTVTITIKVK